MGDPVKVYIRAVKKLFPLYGKQERIYVKNLRDALLEFAEEKEELCYEDLSEEFGSPSHVISEYFSEIDEERLFRQLRYRKYAKILLAGALTVVLIYNGYAFYRAYQNYLEAQDEQIYYEEVIIEEDAPTEEDTSLEQDAPTEEDTLSEQDVPAE